MRVRSAVFVALLLLFTIAPSAEAAPSPVGSCESGSLLEVCVVQCIQPPCPNYVCINTVERICSDL